MKTIHKNLASLSSCTTCVQSGFSNVHLTVLDTEYTVEATNRKIALRVVGGTYVDDTPDPRGGTEALIDAKTWKRVFAQAAKDLQCNMVAVSVGTSDACLIAGSSSHIVPVEEAAFPDLSRIVPKGVPTATIRLASGYLLTLLKAIKDVAGDDAAIEFEIRGEGTPVILRVTTETQKLTGLICPCLGDA